MFSSPIVNETVGQGIPERKQRRQRIETLVYADFGPGNGGFPINVSEGGASFQGIQPLEKGQIICIRFKLPSTKDVVETDGQVVWLNELGKGGGLQFTGLSEKSRRLLRTWLRAQPAEQDDSWRVRARKVEKQKLQPAAAKALTIEQEPSPQALQANVGASPEVVAIRVAATTKTIAPRKMTTASIPFANVLLPGSKDLLNATVCLGSLTIGLAASAAIILAILSGLGLISVQFHWPILSIVG